MDKKILLYFGDHVYKKESVTRVLQTMQIPYRILDDDDLVDSVGYFMELDHFEKSESHASKHFESDLMIIKNVEDDEIVRMNEQMASLQCAMKRKAMLTKHNQHWKVSDLLLEIEKEHQYFTYVDKIQAILTQSRNLIIEAYTTSSWSAYEKAFMEGYEAITKQSSLEDVTRCYQSLIEAKNNLIKIQ